MINNDGAIITECKLDDKFYKQIYNKKTIITVAALILISVIGFVLEILFGKLDFKDEIFFPIVNITVLLCCCVLFVLSLIILFSIFLTVKKSGKSKQSCECELYQAYMIVSVYENGEKRGVAKVVYSDLLKSSETKNYFLAYANANAFYPVPKEGLTPEERNAVRKLFRLRILQGSGVAEIAKYKGALTEAASETQNAQENEVKGE